MNEKIMGVNVSTLKRPKFEQISETISELQKVAAGILRKQGDVADLLVGDEPRPDTNLVREIQSGIANHIGSELESLYDILIGISEQLNRLDEVVATVPQESVGGLMPASGVQVGRCG